MNKNLQTILNLIKSNQQLSDSEKIKIENAIKELDKAEQLDKFKYERAEKDKKVMTVMLDESIQDLERKRKAIEAQNRELEIEAALERVRAKSMAMHHTSELQEVVNTVAQQLHNMEMDITGGAFITINDEVYNELVFWGASGAAETYVQKTSIPFLDRPIYTVLRDAIKRREGFFVEKYTREEKIELFKHMFKHPPYDSSSPEWKKQVLSREGGYTRSVTVSHHTTIFIINHQGRKFSDADNEILKRFGKVFEQSYTRFLDLQKAEEQAREAEIELALERVRARTMAMHKGDELADTALLLFEQITELVIKPRSCGFLIMNEESESMKDWSANVDEKGKASPVTGTLAFDQHPMLSDVVATWRKGAPYFIGEIHGKDLQKYYKAVTSKETTSKAIKEKVLAKANSEFTNSFNFGYGMMYVLTPKAISEHEIDIMLRFAKIFKQTYTRFLDLQKAEAQARESQIELALERIRARTMAMQHSDELSETAQVLFEQFSELGENPDQLSIGIMNETEKLLEIWLSVQGVRMDRMFKAPIDEPIVINKIYTAWKKRKKSLVLDISGSELKKYNDFRNSLPEFKEYNVVRTRKSKEENRRVIYCAFFPKGLLSVATPEPRPAETIKLLERFASVFDLTYTRFLDLQKAETQAREAQIEAALERVRSRTMAMHQSNELADTAAVLFKQLIKLGIEPNRLYIGIMKGESGDVEFWITDEDGSKVSSGFSANLKENRSFKKMLRGWIENKKSITIDMKGKELQDYFQHLQKLHVPFKGGLSQKRRVQNIAYFSQGLIGLASPELQPEETINLLERFAAVFNLTYRRFLDLQKAEAQAREAQIEAALERVRSRTMAMHKSEELAEVVAHLFKQLDDLGIKTYRCNLAIVEESQKRLKIWATTNKGKVIPMAASIPFSLNIHIKKVYQGWKKQAGIVVIKLIGEERLKWTQSINKHMYFAEYKPENIDEERILKEPAILSNFYFNQGFFIIHTLQELDESSINIIDRFSKVFQQTYTRFLDLKKAEAQAREAQIEAALERVRSRSLAMHSSSEFQSVVNVIFDIIVDLQIETDAALLLITGPNPKVMDSWIQSGDRSYSTGIQFNYYENSLISKEIFETRKSQKESLVKTYTKKEKDKHFRIEFKHSLKDLPEERKRYILSGKAWSVSISFAPHIGIFLSRYNDHLFSDADNNVIARLAKVVEQTYTRFLDLQKAEAQAREAEIEAALERVRSRTMGMQRSDELQDAAIVLFQQVEALGVPAFASGFNIWDDDRKAATAWMGGKDRIQPPFKTSSSEDIFLRIYEAAERGESLFVEEQVGEALKTHYEYMLSIPIFKEVADKMAKAGLSLPTFQVNHCAYFSKGYLMFITFEPVPNAYDIFKRFAKVFEQTYTRFLDLQKAEAQAREAIKQASLDRVRGEIASMRTSEDLNRITPIIWHELETLEVPFIRCGVFIVDEENKEVRVYLTTPDGKSLGALNLPFDSNRITSNTVKHWRKNQIYKEHWNKEEFIKWTKSMIEIGQVQNAETYQGSATPPESLNLHFVPFTQGMLYVGDVSPLTEEKLDLVRTLADAFSIAYARYEDFKNIEEAKNKIEITLKELKSTQAQLIHSEKLASLGELTAGIAHEIKNPLNFVNNFSEVSRELLDEMKEELQNKNDEEVNELIESLKQNLDKINQHGKRADSIVKGMLLHSRGTSGEKMLTDINNLLDEYVNLAYHGMRAQNKEFNITMEKDYDKTLEKINVVPQDISRVFMNIISNACYAAFDRRKTSNGDFDPVLKVSTKNLDGKVEIRIGDNGTGIPANILDKIFQPFFTTKPTGEGTGLGLSLSYDIVTKVHGGELKVETKAEEGAEFIITLPSG